MGYQLAIHETPAFARPGLRGRFGLEGLKTVAAPSPAAEVKRGLPQLLPRLWRFARVLCRDTDFAHDLVQATCLRALERASQFQPGTRLDHWTFSILSSIWKNEVEKRKIRTGGGLVDIETILASEDAESLENSVTVKKILGVITGLPETQRIIAMMIYVEGFTFAEASKALDVPVGTLLNRMSTVRARLTEALGEPRVALRRAGGAA
jgi:RNA polymerase sigma-70 factor, ECF subfamily